MEAKVPYDPEAEKVVPLNPGRDPRGLGTWQDQTPYSLTSSPPEKPSLRTQVVCFARWAIDHY
jgi:hypothetical protein